MAFPQQLYAGDTWKLPFNTATTDPLAQLRAHINSAAYQFTSDPLTSTDGAYLFVIAKTVSAAFAPGTYSIAITAEVGDERTTLSTGHICAIEPNQATASSFSYARRMVAALEALLEGRVTNTHALYSAMSFEGRSITTLSIEELHRALVMWRQILRTEEAAKPGVDKPKRMKNILPRF